MKEEQKAAIKTQIQTRNLKAPFTVSYHGDSTILIDADSRAVWGQIPRETAEATAKELSNVLELWPRQETWSVSRYACPACGEPLRKRPVGVEILLWCANGACRSKAANDGESSYTERGAALILKMSVEAEGEGR